MKNNLPLPDFSVSQRIYGRLLRAYPRSHRTEYGAAMQQLFRDQCRDAWNESRAWGLLRLWLRVLPDLASTSILERLAAMKGRKFMSDKLISLTSFRQALPIAAFLSVFAIVFMLVMVSTTIVTFILPESYASTARVMVEPDVAAVNGQSPAYDPYFVQTAFEIIQSQIVLAPVIDKLELNAKWGNKYNGGTPLKTLDTMQLLKQRMSLSPERNTELVNIKVYSDDKVEAAQIANAIAESYRNYRLAHAPENLTGSQANYDRVQIVDSAQPGKMPVRPNKPLNFALGAIMGIFGGSVIGAAAAILAVLIQKRIRRGAV
jgi:capsular polysaccharide biosynthesis protein